MKPDIEEIDNPFGHQSLIRNQWPEFAALAWKKYKEEGRGAIVLDFRNATRSGSMFTVPTFFVSEASEGFVKRGGWPSEEVAEIVRTYDPELDVIFLALRADGDCFHYNVSDDPTPPEA